MRISKMTYETEAAVNTQCPLNGDKIKQTNTMSLIVFKGMINEVIVTTGI